mmetsp:Transcript_1770/g.3219  ORF Transcript_1770/g.3219 Transcript_1770/m.3219 type:complete len:84 (+) Transcript_1770:191-442(+)
MTCNYKFAQVSSLGEGTSAHILDCSYSFIIAYICCFALSRAVIKSLHRSTVSENVQARTFLIAAVAATRSSSTTFAAWVPCMA